MARKKVTEQVLTDWDEVNESLKTICSAQNAIAAIEGEMNEQIAAIKKEAKEKVKAHESVIKINEVLIQQYATEHKTELKGKSRRMAFGTVGFRLSTKLVLPREIKTVIDNLKSSGMMDCLNTTVTVNKEVLKTYDEKEIISVGASLRKEDTFWYETERDKVQDS